MMRQFLIFLALAIGTAACGPLTMGDPAIESEQKAPNQAATAVPQKADTPQPAPARAALPVLGPAPDWQNETWINTESPLTLADVRGKVVLLEFWTFG